MNRARLRYRGATVANVCLYPFQFSCWGEAGGSDNYRHTLKVAEAVAAGIATPLPVNAMELAIWDESLWVAEGLVNGLIRDRVAGALHYMTTKLYRENPPRWAPAGRACCEVGAHIFLRGIA